MQATAALEEQARVEYDTWMRGKSMEEKQHKRQANIQQRQDARLAKVLQHQRQVKQDIHAQRWVELATVLLYTTKGAIAFIPPITRSPCANDGKVGRTRRPGMDTPPSI